MNDLMESRLASIQHWTLTAITSPNGLTPGLARAQAEQNWTIDDIIAAPSGVNPSTRLNIYAEGYWLRLLACLHADYPATLRLMGESLFDFFARGYLAFRPSRSPSLYDLGAKFPHFLRCTQDRKTMKLQRFPLDLAALERAYVEVLRSPGLEKETATIIADPALLLIDRSYEIALPQTTRILALSHRLSSFSPWLEGNGPGKEVDVGRDYAVIRRHQFRVFWERLTDWQFFALRYAAHSPQLLIDCARAAARRTGRSLPEILALLAFWLPVAQSNSLIILHRRLLSNSDN